MIGGGLLALAALAAVATIAGGGSVQPVSRQGYANLPPDLVKAIDDYEEDKADGRIRFDDGSEFASQYPESVETDNQIGDWVTDHVDP